MGAITGINKVIMELLKENNTKMEELAKYLKINKETLEKHIALDSIQSFIFAIPVSTDDAELSIDMEFNRTHVYSAKTGKRLYTLKSVSGFRIAEYKRNIFGVVAKGTKPYSVITYGTLDNTWMKATKQDIEI